MCDYFGGVHSFLTLVLLSRFLICKGVSGRAIELWKRDGVVNGRGLITSM